jgi:hypothetical protein
MRSVLVQEKSMRLLPLCILKTILVQVLVATRSWYCAKNRLAAGPKAGNFPLLVLLKIPVEASGRRRPSHTAVSALRLRLLSSALPADSVVENCIFEIEIT